MGVRLEGGGVVGGILVSRTVSKTTIIRLYLCITCLSSPDLGSDYSLHSFIFSKLFDPETVRSV